MFIALGTFAQGYKHYSIENGLPSNRIYKIQQDRKGFIWIATDKGLSKFDGKSFKNFTTQNGLPTNDIWEFLITDDNKIWYFTRSNKLGYIQNDSIYTFSDDNNTAFYPTYLTKVGNQIRFRSFSRNYQFAHKKWQMLDVDNGKDVIINVINNKVNKIYVYDDFMHFVNKEEKLAGKVKCNKNISFINQINDSLVVAQNGQKLFFINLNQQKIFELERPDLFVKNKFIRVLTSQNQIQISGHNFWAEISNDYKLKNIHYFSKNRKASTVFKDNNGNYWLNTFNNGIYFVNKSAEKASFFLQKQKIRQLKRFGNNIFAGVIDKGLYKYNDKKNNFELLFSVNGYIYDFYVEDDDNFIVISNWYMYIKHKGKIKKIIREGKKLRVIDNNYYFMSLDGMKKYDLVTKKVVDMLPLRDIELLIKFDNRLIAGTTAGLFTIDATKTYTNIKGFKHSVLSGKVVKKELFIGTDGFGLYVWDGKESISQVEGTKNLIVNNIEVTGDKLLLATQKGVLLYHYEDNKLIFEKTIRKIDGLMSDQVNNVLVQRDKLFAASYNGVSMLNIDQEEISPMQAVYFKRISFNNIPLDSLHQTVKYVSQNNLLINFGIIDFSGQEHDKYYYKLSPIQDRWIETKSNVINFNNLSPNDYILSIKVKNPYKQQIIKQLSFSILPLWWQTPFAKILESLFILSIFTLIAFQIRRVELKKQQKKLIAQKEMVEFELYALRSQMNPHFVFNSLNAIQYYINDKNFIKSEIFLVKFARLIRMIFDFSSKKSIKLTQEIKLLRSYLTLEKLRFGDNFNFCIDIDKTLLSQQTEIPTMLLQPIVENAVNHGLFHKKGKGTICLSFSELDSKTFTVSISDDGIGIEKSKEIYKKSLKKHQSKSTKILMNRIKLLNISGQWKVYYQLKDLKKDNSEYNTVITLKISKL